MKSLKYSTILIISIFCSSHAMNQQTKKKLIICDIDTLWEPNKDFVKKTIWKTLSWSDLINITSSLGGSFFSSFDYSVLTSKSSEEYYQNKLFTVLENISLSKKTTENIPICYGSNQKLPTLLRLLLLTKTTQELNKLYKKACEKINIEPNSTDKKILLQSLNIPFGKDTMTIENTMIMTGMLKIINQYKNYKIVFCGNMAQTIFNDFVKLKNNTIAKNFNLKKNCFISSHLTMLKPCKNFYQHILDSCKINGKEAIFIDRYEEHFDNAKKLGITCIHFNGKIDKLKKDLDTALQE